VQNKAMSFYEELLTLGQHLHERERLALYRFLVENKYESYKSDALKLIKSKELMGEIANGEITYLLKGNVVTYSTRRTGTSTNIERVREVKLNAITRFRIRKLIKFFAQAEVEVIWNFPLQGQNPQEEGSYCILSYPYFDLRYFSNGRGRVVGLAKKLRVHDSDLRQKLKATY
jgi:hypothetical protein